MESKEAKELVVKAGIELVDSGLIARTWGNVSCRIDEERFAITPSGRDYLTLTIDDIVEVKIEDLSYESDIKPSSEKGIHAEVYHRLPDINFVIHTHQENASAISASGLEKISLSECDFEHSKSLFNDEILCAQYGLPGTKTLRKNVVDALEHSKSNAIILKNHGALCYGTDYESTMQIAKELESISSNFIEKSGYHLKFSDEKNNAPENINRLKDFEQAVLIERGGNVVLNTDPEILSYCSLSKPLLPYLDDFAQIIGLKAQIVNDNEQSILKALRHSSAVLIKDLGALCWGKDKSDATAVNMILKKNCKAYFTANIFNKSHPINKFECALMRFIYLKKYSRLSEK